MISFEWHQQSLNFCDKSRVTTAGATQVNSWMEIDRTGSNGRKNIRNPQVIQGGVGDKNLFKFQNNRNQWHPSQTRKKISRDNRHSHPLQGVTFSWHQIKSVNHLHGIQFESCEGTKIIIWSTSDIFFCDSFEKSCDHRVTSCILYLWPFDWWFD